MRHLLSIRARPTAAAAAHAELKLATSHMESLKHSSYQRVDQLHRTVELMDRCRDDTATPNVCTVIVGGALNLRDWEVNCAGSMPPHIHDVWELLGRPEGCGGTWKPHGDSHVSRRFDRLLITHRSQAAPACRWQPVSMELVGSGRLLYGSGPFISDHCGVLVQLQLS
mmetsp:Transcript_16350/g.46540  ORF Transcript_16350/g.46540 Transcript_16350/m.46540 type:complete len:168 (-) Transcript_16350:1283-1786(-)